MLLGQDINMTASSFMSTSNNSNSGQMANMEDDKSIVLHNRFTMIPTNNQSQRQRPSERRIPLNEANNHSDEEIKKITNEQRLLRLLYHAAKCTDETNCTMIQNCANMKILWQHMHLCQNNKCTVPGCVSSRTVYFHYRNCNDSNCPVCAPVRNIIRDKLPRSSMRSGRPLSSLHTIQARNPRNRSVRCSCSAMSPPFSPSGHNSHYHAYSSTPQQQHAMQNQNQPISTVTQIRNNSTLQSSQPRFQHDGNVNICNPPCVPVCDNFERSDQGESSQCVGQPFLDVMRGSDNMAGPAPPFYSASSPSQTGGTILNLNWQGLSYPHSQHASASTFEVEATRNKTETTPSTCGVEGFSTMQLTDNEINVSIDGIEQPEMFVQDAQLPPTDWNSECTKVLTGLQSHQYGFVFNDPVDPVALDLPDYFDIVKKPMDLGTVQERLENGFYHSIDEFASDVNLTFDNATAYNEDGSAVYNVAIELKTNFSSALQQLYDQLEKRR